MKERGCGFFSLSVPAEASHACANRGTPGFTPKACLALLKPAEEEGAAPSLAWLPRDIEALQRPAMGQRSIPSPAPRAYPALNGLAKERGVQLPIAWLALMWPVGG